MQGAIVMLIALTGLGCDNPSSRLKRSSNIGEPYRQPRRESRPNAHLPATLFPILRFSLRRHRDRRYDSFEHSAINPL